MKQYQIGSLIFFVAAAILLPSCAIEPAADRTAISSVPPELLQQSYLYEVIRHLYRWHLDESEIERMVGSKQFVFWVRSLEPRLDPGDRSVLAEILLPQLDITVKVKKADYTIEETGTVVKSPGFRITRISRGALPGHCPQAGEKRIVEMQHMRDYLFRTRNQRDYPDAVMMEYLRQAVRNQVAQEDISVKDIPPGDRVVHLAPLSPVANETWVLWEDGRKLFYFASDIDLANPAVWEHDTLMARIFDLDQQVIVTADEAPGSNRFLTRYQVSRALFNCVVLGRRMTVPPPSSDNGQQSPN